MTNIFNGRRNQLLEGQRHRATEPKSKQKFQKENLQSTYIVCSKFSKWKSMSGPLTAFN